VELVAPQGFAATENEESTRGISYGTHIGTRIKNGISHTGSKWHFIDPLESILHHSD
jgi:hypothetical protein